MTARPSKFNAKFLLISTLLVMILARLAWVQLRIFPISSDLRSLITLEYVAKRSSYNCKLLDPIHSLWPTSYPYNTFTDGEAEGRDIYFPYKSNAFALYLLTQCNSQLFSPGKFIKKNQALLALTIFLAALITRFISKSWTLSMITAAVLLSRGRILTSIGSISYLNLMMLFITFWFTCISHYIKSASNIVGALIIIVTSMLCFLDPPLWGASIAISAWIITLYAISRFPVNKLKSKKKENNIPSFIAWPKLYKTLVKQIVTMLDPSKINDTPPSDEKGGVLKSMKIQFISWISIKKRWFIISVIFLILSIILLGTISFSYEHQYGAPYLLLFKEAITPEGEWLLDWYHAWASLIDIDIAVALIVILISALTSISNTLSGLKEISWFIIITIIYISISSLIMDYFENQQMILSGLNDSEYITNWGRAKTLIFSLEPVLLTVGIIGIYNLLKKHDETME